MNTFLSFRIKMNDQSWPVSSEIAMPQRKNTSIKYYYMLYSFGNTFKSKTLTYADTRRT